VRSELTYVQRKFEEQVETISNLRESCLVLEGQVSSGNEKYVQSQSNLEQRTVQIKDLEIQLNEVQIAASKEKQEVQAQLSLANQSIERKQEEVDKADRCASELEQNEMRLMVGRYSMFWRTYSMMKILRSDINWLPMETYCPVLTDDHLFA
jgi:chromosome segregation ATPase